MSPQLIDDVDEAEDDESYKFDCELEQFIGDLILWSSSSSS